MKYALTATAVKNAKLPPDKKQLKLADGGGLYLLLTATGSRLWRYKYRLAKEEHTYAIGAYPEISLQQAREEHSKAREVVASGGHPRAVREQLKLQKLQEGADTFEYIAEEWIAKRKVAWSPYYLSQIRRAMDKDVFPAIGGMPIRQVTPLHLLALIKKVEARGAEVVAENIRQLASQIFRFAILNLRADTDPAAALKGVVQRPKIKHNIPLSPSQISDLLLRLKKSGGNRTTKLAIELLLLTFVRTVELRKARWTEFDIEGGIWRIPAERMKMGVEHLVPLSLQSIALLKELQAITGGSPWLFPNYRRPDDCMTPTTINRALERMGLNGAGTIGFAAHGFRGTASTLLHEWGFRHEAIERQLAHSERNKVSSAYNQAQYLAERTQMMSAWALKIDELRQEKKAEIEVLAT
ncbi:tyrosine-type recombinase/integrase [Roseateles sp. PN1]|uniref:tyrosine-type recombinase/integrase n=1 Tax=Roseateles sp. PN1 TaxID=3137372 RepID=UPI00313900BB